MTDVCKNKSGCLLADVRACTVRMRGDCGKFSVCLSEFFGGNIYVGAGKEAYHAENRRG